MRAFHIETPPSNLHATSASAPLTPEHIRQIEDARTRSKKVRRAAGVAKGSGWSLAFFAFISLAAGLFGDVTSLVVGAALGILAFNELRGGKMIGRFDPHGARVLGWNQLVLGLVILAYSLWKLTHPESVGEASGNAEVDEMVQNISSMVTYGLYGTLAVVGFLGCGLTAMYYFTRARIVREMVSGTPAWVLETMKAAA